jgi:hypothetical protein
MDGIGKFYSQYGLLHGCLFFGSFMLVVDRTIWIQKVNKVKLRMIRTYELILKTLSNTSTLRLSAFFGFFGNFLLAQTYYGTLPSHFQLCAMYLVLTGFSSSAAYLCALDSQVTLKKTLNWGVKGGVPNPLFPFLSLPYEHYRCSLTTFDITAAWQWALQAPHWVYVV